MIPSNELRINNWVFDGALGNNKIIQLDDDFLEVLFAARNYEDLQPIPLTPEILERAGFKNGERFAGLTHLKVIAYETVMQGKFVGEYRAIILDTIPYSLNKSIKYVHQLQNLYFALTGEELEITL